MIPAYLIQNSRLNLKRFFSAASAAYDMSIFRQAKDTLIMFLVDHLRVLFIPAGICPEHPADLFGHLLQQFILHAFMDKNIIRRHTGLSAV